MEQWASAQNRFDAPGEILCGHLDQGLLVAVGALIVIRLPAVRKWAASAEDLRKACMAEQRHRPSAGDHSRRAARNHFRCVRLRAENANAARLYERIGFVPIESPDATHILLFDR